MRLQAAPAADVGRRPAPRADTGLPAPRAAVDACRFAVYLLLAQAAPAADVGQQRALRAAAATTAVCLLQAAPAAAVTGRPALRAAATGLRAALPAAGTKIRLAFVGRSIDRLAS